MQRFWLRFVSTEFFLRDMWDRRDEWDNVVGILIFYDLFDFYVNHTNHSFDNLQAGRLRSYGLFFVHRLHRLKKLFLKLIPHSALKKFCERLQVILTSITIFYQ
ncbi:MAG: hypothetical protein LBP59_04925 [Planctomycetaceae bacterium]|nr:hypothetical protein [Planctomycetaceae bacterium]